MHLRAAEAAVKRIDFWRTEQEQIQKMEQLQPQRKAKLENKNDCFECQIKPLLVEELGAARERASDKRRAFSISKVYALNIRAFLERHSFTYVP